MSRTQPTCREIEPELVAMGVGEAPPATVRIVEEHIAGCPECRDELGRYRALDGLVADMRHAPMPAVDPSLARAELESRLADLRRRLLTFGVFTSPLGPILIARSIEGVSMVEYLESHAAAASHLARLAGVDAIEDESETRALYQDLLEYLEGRRHRLGWPLDLRLASSDFQRRVLQVTSQLPYGAVTSYGHIAREIGAPTSTRAVAQALRRNPLPIVIPCHRVIGGTGDLVGYAGNKVGLKERLLTLEGVPVAGAETLHVQRNAMYVRYQAGEEYCLPTCGELPSTPLSELTLFGSREHAEDVGLTPCSSCRPDVNPMPAPV